MISVKRKPLLSVVVATKNEEKNIKACLNTVGWVDEIIVVDMESTDRTVEFAKKLGARTFISDGGPHKLVHHNRNIGFRKARGRWIFILDADERVSSRLRQAIQEVTKSSKGYLAYKVSIPTYYWGKWLFHGWDLKQIRLFQKKESMGFIAETVHEHLEIDGEVGELDGQLFHFGHVTLSELIEKMNRYTSIDARIKFESGVEPVRWFHLFKDAMYNFYAHYILMKAYKDGMHGLTMSLMMAIYHFVERVKIWELQYKQQDDELHRFDRKL